MTRRKTQPLAVHPVADLFPMLDAEDLQSLAQDIADRGLLHPIVLDAAGRVLDGRNRLAACQLADVAPAFVDYDGADPDGYALAVNIARRNMTKGQTAMVAARARILNMQSQKAAAEAVSVSPANIGHAAIVLEWAPDLADSVVAGVVPLNDAYKTARQRKTDADRAEARFGRLPPDLAEQVRDERLTLTEAEAARDQRQRDLEAKQRDARTLLTRIIGLAAMPLDDIPPWADHIGEPLPDDITGLDQAISALAELRGRLAQR